MTDDVQEIVIIDSVSVSSQGCHPSEQANNVSVSKEVGGV